MIPCNSETCAYALVRQISDEIDIVLILSGEILSWSLMGVKGLAIRHCWAVVLNSMNINQFQLTGFCWFFLDLELLLSNV